MSWDFTNLAKSALSTAQKRIDKVLDIQNEEADAHDYPAHGSTSFSNIHEDSDDTLKTLKNETHDVSGLSSTAKQLQGDFFAAFGLGGLGGSPHGQNPENLDPKASAVKETTIEAPKKSDSSWDASQKDADNSGFSSSSFISSLETTTTKQLGYLSSSIFASDKAEQPKSEEENKSAPSGLRAHHGNSWSSWLGGIPPSSEADLEKFYRDGALIDQSKNVEEKQQHKSQDFSTMENDSKNSEVCFADPDKDEIVEILPTKEIKLDRSSYEEVELIGVPSVPAKEAVGVKEIGDQEVLAEEISAQRSEANTNEASISAAQLPLAVSESESSNSLVSDWVQNDGWKIEDEQGSSTFPDEESVENQEGDRSNNSPPELVLLNEGSSLRPPSESSSMQLRQDASPTPNQSTISLTTSSSASTTTSATLGRPESSCERSELASSVGDGEEDSSGQSQGTIVDAMESPRGAVKTDEIQHEERQISLMEELSESETKIKPESEAAGAVGVESILHDVSNKLSPRSSCSDPISVQVTTTDAAPADAGTVTPEEEGGSEESSGGAGHSSIADSFVHLEASEGSPPLSIQKSETSSVVKGSGYTSPTDELETAASNSDIEVIWANNGDAWSERSSRSGTNMGLSGKLGNIRETDGKKTHRRSGSDHVLTESGTVTHISAFSSDKQKQLSEVLEAREKNLLEFNRDIVQLRDENESLRRQLKHIQEEKVGTEKALVNIQEKFTAVSEERDKHRKKCERLERENQNSGIGIPQLQRLLREKEEQIEELVKEGDKLSKRELKHSSIIKKLREKEKETEKLMESQKQKLTDMDSLKQKLRDKNTQEIKYDEAMHQMKSTIEKQEKRILRQQTELEETNEKSRSLKVTLENAYKQISELTREKVAKETEIHKLKSEAEASGEQKLQEKVQELEKEKSSERSDLSRQIEELQVNLVQSSAESDRREQSLKWEISQLQRKLQEAENRNDELSDSISSATKPLLRQIENLQQSFTAQQTNWERLEKSLYDRITDSEQKALIASDKERSASAVALEARAQQGQLEARIKGIKREKAKIEDQLSVAKRDSDRVEEMRNKFQSDLELERSMNKRALEDLEREKELLAAQFQHEKTQSKTELEKKVTDLLKQVDEKEQMLTVMRTQLIEQQMTAQTAGGRNSPTRAVSGVGFFPDFRRSVSPSSTITSFAEDSGDDFWTMPQDGTGFTSLLEKLRAKLQQRDGELAVLRDEVRHLQQSRESVTHELVNIGNSQQAMEQRVSDYDSLQEEYREIDQKYQALLQMYGEKVEENEELRLDLQDVKSMYKQQIQDLLTTEASINQSINQIADYKTSDNKCHGE